MVSSPHNGQHHIRFYLFLDRLKTTSMATLPFPLKQRQTKVLPGSIKTCRRGLFTIPPTSNINGFFTCVREMPHEPPPERDSFTLCLSWNKPHVEHLLLSESYLTRVDHTTKYQISLSSAANAGLGFKDPPLATLLL